MGPALYLLLGAMNLVGPDRPPALLGDASSVTYASWLARIAIETEGAHNGVERQACANATAQSLGWRPTVDPYLARTVARYGTASLVEKVRVTGCGRDHVQTLVVSRGEGPGFNVIRLSQASPSRRSGRPGARRTPLRKRPGRERIATAARWKTACGWATRGCCPLPFLASGPRFGR